MRSFLLLAAAALAVPASAQPAPAAPDYSKPASWLCLPGRADTCAKPLPTTGEESWYVAVDYNSTLNRNSFLTVSCGDIIVPVQLPSPS